MEENEKQSGGMEMTEKRILETERLYLREMTISDFAALCKILQDEKAMYAYEGALDDEEAREWLDRQLVRYKKLGFGLWAVILKETGEMIGQCGLSMQPWQDRELLEIGYLFAGLSGIRDMPRKRQGPVRIMLLKCSRQKRSVPLFAIPIRRLKRWP